VTLAERGTRNNQTAFSKIRRKESPGGIPVLLATDAPFGHTGSWLLDSPVSLGSATATQNAKEIHVSTSTVEVFVAMYGTEDGAAAAAKDFQAAERGGAIDLIDAAVVVHTAAGKVTIDETGDPSGKKWAKRGAIAGGVVGLIFPPSIIVSAAVGGAGGGVWGKIRDKGFKDDDLKAIGDSLQPGTSAIIAVAEDRMAEQLASALEGYDKIAKHAVSAEAAALIAAEVDDESE
jgi:uncharacterized membrane protein